MNKLHTFLSHTTVILSLMFIVFLILDQFNPMMNFVDNGLSRWLLLALCLSGIGQSVLKWAQDGRKQIRGPDQPPRFDDSRLAQPFHFTGNG